MKNITIKFKDMKNLTSADLDDVISVGYILTNGKICEKDYDQAAAVYSEVIKYAPLYEKVATRDNLAVIENNYGDVLSRKDNPHRDVEKAMALFHTSAARGYGLAMTNIGYHYEKGTSDSKHTVEQDYKEALKWYRKAAIAGEPKGMFNLGNMYHWGWGTKKDPELALDIFKTLIEKYDHTEAYFYIGYYYENGLVVKKDENIAFKAYLVGAERGDNYACNEVGRCYCKGIGTEKDESEGLKWYLKAGELGDSLGYSNAGYAYEAGHGTAKDLQQAKYYYKLSADMGNEHATEALKRIEEEEKSAAAKASKKPEKISAAKELYFLLLDCDEIKGSMMSSDSTVEAERYSEKLKLSLEKIEDLKKGMKKAEIEKAKSAKHAHDILEKVMTEGAETYWDEDKDEYREGYKTFEKEIERQIKNLENSL